MKTNICTLLILLLSFSFANAQDAVVKLETEKTITVSDDNENTTVVNANSVELVNKKETVKAETVEVKETVAKSHSDIRIYLNRVRKVENIKWLFPKINKAKVA